MKISYIVCLGTLSCFLPVGSASAGALASKPVALVYSLTGEAMLTSPGEGRFPLRLFDRLVVGTTLEVGPGSRLALAFATGRRYELVGAAKATLGRTDLSFRSRAVRTLPSFPPLPRLLPIAKAEEPGWSAGAVRIRTEKIAGLYPRHGAATLAETTLLRFEPVEGASRYRVEVQNHQGNVIFATETTSTTVNAVRVLQAGMRYAWTVRTRDRVGPMAVGQADFITLPSREAKAREALRKAVETAGDGASLALLAEVDQSLGLLAEARDELRAAVHRSPEDVRLAAVLAELERRLSPPDRAAADKAGIWPIDLLLSWSQEIGNIGRGHLTKAQELFKRALEIFQEVAPALNDPGPVDCREGRPVAAEQLCRATETFDQQRKKVRGTPEERLSFGGKTAEPYRDCIAALVEAACPEEAFRVLERGRARSFLDLLAERDLSWTADLPPDLARDRKQTNAEYDCTQTSFASLSLVRDQAEIDRLLVRLRDLHARQEEIAAKIRQASPRVAALQDPQPLDLSGARAVLDPGTVLLAWSIGRERSFLFVVQPEGMEPALEVFPLPLGDQALRRRVEVFRNLLQRADSDRAALTAQARDLYDTLLRPAEPRIASARRILVSPDGPLHTLPFSALVRNGRWLAEQKPIHAVLSATVYAELKKSRRQASAAAPVVLAAFGDPLYPPPPPQYASTVDPNVHAVVGRGLPLTSLPSSGEEVRTIASLYPGARTFLGAEATEERAKSIGKDTRYLHIASHGLLDEDFPLNSALALTIPVHPREGEDDGLLQAWEIFESVRLDADLVTLSACDSALGEEMGGEGLVGLVRAFQFAGARSVLASLWSVSDASTADLMKRFYGHLRAGKSKDDALQAAQIALIRSRRKGFSHPYYWATFQLAGDWR